MELAVGVHEVWRADCPPETTIVEVMDEALGVVRRLTALSGGMARSADRARDARDARYRACSAALVERERNKLAEALDHDDPVATASALRSVADMMKGLIDAGADFPESAPNLWQEASDIVDHAHALERASR